MALASKGPLSSCREGEGRSLFPYDHPHHLQNTPSWTVYPNLFQNVIASALHQRRGPEGCLSEVIQVLLALDWTKVALQWLLALVSPSSFLPSSPFLSPSLPPYEFLSDEANRLLVHCDLALLGLAFFPSESRDPEQGHAPWGSHPGTGTCLCDRPLPL